MGKDKDKDSARERLEQIDRALWELENEMTPEEKNEANKEE